jgi:hypothetical protein
MRLPTLDRPLSSLPKHLAPADREQIAHVVATLRVVLGENSSVCNCSVPAVLGGLRAQSDIDVLAVSARRTTHDEKRRLVTRRLDRLRTDPAAAPPRRVELTIVVSSEMRPWRYPPAMDFQYGEWWRETFVGPSSRCLRHKRGRQYAMHMSLA